MILSILIPTYNREKFLAKNLTMLLEIIYNNNFENSIEIIISNNNSSDNTHKNTNKIIEMLDTAKIINYFCQDENLGLERNAIFTLQKAKGKYVMYLGDDDYIKEEYLIKCFKKISNHHEIFCIIPSCEAIDIEGNPLGIGRDLYIPSKIYNLGFRNCLENSWRGHQLSGLVLRSENLLEEYLKNNIKNIYPFIFFVAYSCLIGKTWHFTDYPVQVTQPGQNKKDWGYGNDGLIGEIFDNYLKLNKISYLQKVLLEVKLLEVQSWRYFSYSNKGLVTFFSAVKAIIKNKNTLMLTKIIFPFLIIKRIVKNRISRVLKNWRKI